MRYLVALFISLSCNYSYSQNPYTKVSCKKFIAQAKAENLVTLKSIQVPLDYSAKNSSQKIEIFYWIKKGTNPSKVPLLLIHGGPGGNSWRYYSSFKNSSYEGDIISIDNRNEGCSNVIGYGETPYEYDKFRARSIVRDLEALRINLYGRDGKWRVFGQSRGVTIAHYYLEMFPENLESVQTHGGAMTTSKTAKNYTLQRSYFNARASQRFSIGFPEAAKIVGLLRNYFDTQKLCLPMNFGMMDLPNDQRPKVCGSLIVDSMSYKLSNYSRWSELSSSLTALKLPNDSIDYKKAIENFQKEIDGNIYVQYMNYIIGSSSPDIGSLAPSNFQEINKDKYLQSALISEGRFIANAVYPAYLSLNYPKIRSSSDQLDFNKVKSFLRNFERKNSRKFEFTIYSSFFDTIGGPELYLEEKQIFGRLVDFKVLHNSGHEGWGTEKEILDMILR